MNFLKDLGEIVDDDYQLEVDINTSGLVVKLGYKYANEGNPSFVPIKFSIPNYNADMDVFEMNQRGYAYIPQDDFVEEYIDAMGLDVDDIDEISSIMHYLESHSSEIEEICHSFRGSGQTN